MLPEPFRLRTREEHARLGRFGRRFRAGPVVVHSLVTETGGPPRAGFVVGRRVGKAVVRNRVRRRLREQTRLRLGMLPPGTAVLVRALPEAADATSAQLGEALDRAFRAIAASRSRAGAASRGPAGPPKPERAGQPAATAGGSR